MDWQSQVASAVDCLEANDTPISVVHQPAQPQSTHMGQRQGQGASVGPGNAQSQGTHAGNRPKGVWEQQIFLAQVCHTETTMTILGVQHRSQAQWRPRAMD